MVSRPYIYGQEPGYVSAESMGHVPDCGISHDTELIGGPIPRRRLLSVVRLNGSGQRFIGDYNASARVFIGSGFAFFVHVQVHRVT